MSVILKSVRHSGLLACAGLAGLLLASPAAFAQAPPPLTTSSMNCTTTQFSTPVTINNIGTLAIPASAASAAISAAIGNVSTAFLTQQGSAFVSAPANPAPDQPGGGVWARGVGGQAEPQLDVEIPSAFRPRAAPSSIPPTTNCNNQQTPDLRGRAGRRRHRPSQLRRLESPSRDDGRLSRLENHRQRGLRQRFRSPLLGHLLRRHQGTLLCRPDGSPGVLQYQPEQPGASPSATSRSGPTAGRSRHRRAIISIWARAGSSSRRPASSIPRPRSTPSPRPASPAPTSPASPASFRPAMSRARSAARRCASARPSRRRT